MRRELQPEWLDALPAGDPAAVRSRRELRRVNRLMGNARHLAAALQGLGCEGTACADLGAGDGWGAVSWASRLPPGSRRRLVLVDRAECVSTEARAALQALGWEALPVTGEIPGVLKLGGVPEFETAVANLFLHHLDEARLAELFAWLGAACRGAVFCEPRRSRFAWAAASLLGAVGCGPVTRHDARVSVRAGFTGRELAGLWPGAGWRVEERRAGLFSHLFVARRH